MDLAQPRTRLALGGAAAALAAGGLIALALVLPHRGEPASPPPASQAGLVIDASGANVGRIDPAKPLRCFVSGKMVGELSLAECARRNGVATDALAVAPDASGALVAREAATAASPQAPAAAPAVAARADTSAAATCWSYAGGQWRALPSDTSINGCVQALFAGRCERAGGATYGRWGQQTLRLVSGKVEVSSDDSHFRTLVEQGPGCSVPSAG